MINKKYLLTLGTVAVMSTAAFTGCSKKNEAPANNETSTPVVTETPVEEETPAEETPAVEETETTGKYVDGTYTHVAAEAENGYTYEATVVVENGAITSVNWDAKDEQGQSKKDLANKGEYVMTEDGPTWTEQSEALSAFVVENQSLDGLTTTDDAGHTDVVAGVSIKINGFKELVEACLSDALTGTTATTTAYVDGTYTAVADEAENGYTYEVTMTVENGAITSVIWDAKDEQGQSKRDLANKGEYVMTEDGPTWTEQSEALGAFVVEHQSLDNLTTTDDAGHTDAVAGVSIKIGNFLSLVENCINQAKAN